MTQSPNRWIVPARLFDGHRFHHGIAVRIDAGHVVTLGPAADAGADGAPVERSEATLIPGYVDVQVNGGGGVLFNANPTPDGLRTLARAHRARGTMALLPTLITDAPDVMDRAVEAMLTVHGEEGIVGIHLEGPHISVARKGAHRAELIRPIDERTFAAVERLRSAGIPTMVTLAPEENPPGSIARLAAMGVTVSIGHTAADAATVRAAIAEGARAATHLHNAMTPMTAREPGVVGAALDSDLFCGFIADGIHVAYDVLRVSIRSRPHPGRMVLVSDAMPTVGGPDHFELYGETIRVRQGALVNSAGALAGVHIDMAGSVRNLVGAGIPLADALAMATSAPAELMGLSGAIGGIAPGASADLCWLESDLSVRPIANGAA